MRILSLGAGVQSSALALMAYKKYIEKIDFAVFADTGNEPDNVYEYLDYIKSIVNYDIFIVSKGNLYNDTINNIQNNKWLDVPFFTLRDKKKGTIRRTCTHKYKINPIRKFVHSKIKEKNLKQADMLIGISMDEIQRMTISNVKYLKNVYPLIEKRLSRYDCVEWLKENKFKLPERSACVICPYHKKETLITFMKNQKYKNLLLNLDKNLQNNNYDKLDSEMFITNERKRIKDINFEDTNIKQLDLFTSDCEGMCGL